MWLSLFPNIYSKTYSDILMMHPCQDTYELPERQQTEKTISLASSLAILHELSLFHRIGIDLLGRFLRLLRWIVLCSDYLTVCAITKALPTAEAPKVVTFLLGYISLKMTTGCLLKKRLKALTRRQADMLSKLICSLKWSNRIGMKYYPFLFLHITQPNRILPDSPRFYLIYESESETTLGIIFPICIEQTEYVYISILVSRVKESRQLVRLRTFEAREKIECDMTANTERIISLEISYGFSDLCEK
ncbi:reverse transcriptase [Caerostris extrusa]|uniref:Reverse transcriptase n=1 Tax=Caerostris extrusa TaxID=172846 RepID=A0AAV4VX54_CAEEX|nr:reverse transcriptase [Caerostris extrusa]